MATPADAERIAPVEGSLPAIPGAEGNPRAVDIEGWVRVGAEALWTDLDAALGVARRTQSHVNARRHGVARSV